VGSRRDRTSRPCPVPGVKVAPVRTLVKSGPGLLASTGTLGRLRGVRRPPVFLDGISGGLDDTRTGNSQVRTCRTRQPASHHVEVVKDDGVPDKGQAPLPRRTRGRPSPWVPLTLAVFFGCLATASWFLGESLLLSITWTVGAACLFGASLYARRHANDPLPPGRGDTSRWGGGRPDERWQ
jgi:hypothetical protein